MSREESAEIPSVVSEVLPNATYRVKIESDQDIVVTCDAMGPIASLPLLPGDMVLVEVQPYDLSRGRILLRLT